MNAKVMSAMMAAVLMCVCSANAAVIADSVADFSATQGANGWMYGYYGSEFSPSTFAAYDAYNSAWGYAWSSGSSLDWGFVSADQAYPGTGARAAVRRWTSDYAGTITLSGLIQKEGGPDQSWNNGVRARVYVTTGSSIDCIVDQYIPGTDTSLHTYGTTWDVQVGSTVDFVLDGYWNQGCDRSTFTAQIVPEPATMALLAMGGVAMLRRRLA
jgi:hypothetical protein